ncbi:hypothetical protein BMETH_109_2 [methanotrophic bacterial endosymbiont of Bathymodiolus sp.]|nr:hypothetical protein BMETH_109_2 [methanotrophic bacterial endosymbiont of Bathymodiolus sp.]
MTTLRADIGISSPVLGFLPGRLLLSLNSNFPKPEIFTCSPCSSEVLICSKKVQPFLSLRVYLNQFHQTIFQRNLL